jgi:hypothetical protein
MTNSIAAKNKLQFDIYYDQSQVLQARSKVFEAEIEVINVYLRSSRRNLRSYSHIAMRKDRAKLRKKQYVLLKRYKRITKKLWRLVV